MPKIVTENVYPPIPLRQFDWVAHYDDEEGPTGTGATEQEAIEELLTNHPPCTMQECVGPALRQDRRRVSQVRRRRWRILPLTADKHGARQ